MVIKDIKKNLYGITIGGYSLNIPFLGDNLSTEAGVVDKVTQGFNLAIGLSALAAVVMIVFAGYMFITASGDPEKIEKGQNAITAAVVGMAIVFLAKVLVVFILEKVLGASY